MPPRPDALLRVNCFQVLIGDRELAFASVGPLASTTTAPDERGDRPVNRFSNMILRRALTTSHELFDWRRRIVDGKDDRREVTIRQLSAPGGEVVNAWQLVGARPVRWSGPAFDAMAGDVAIEEVELAFDDLVWLKDTTR
jgi:phage tail-like protein